MSKKLIQLIGAFGILVLLAGCFNGEQSSKEVDPPQNAEAVYGEETVDGEDAAATPDEAEDTVSRELYLIDSNGMVASQTVELPVPESNQVAQQVIEYLVKGGPITPMLPNGFQAVLPEETEVLGLDLQEDGTIVVDLSGEFSEYEASSELPIIEAVTYTLTQFDNVQKVKLRVEGEDLAEMPVNGTPLNNGYTRANGINLINNDTLDYFSSNPVTMFYPVEKENNRYYVPVTQYVKMDDENDIAGIVNELIEGPGYQNNVLNVFNPEAALTAEPVVEEGVANLVFNEGILMDQEQHVISDEVMETIVRTLTAQPNVDAVNVQVENVDEVFNENGEPYSEPVSAQLFTPSEEL
ncbi:GerMN domain-containing protein [Oceanobacillus neutriphilus]|uniref:Spore germination protein GerM n=1 Tax=Oceanobacillus neutriphilus TaxID=531815 RepID=A0ABQ2NY46_9BACI|nr:GerMN domain-containing protein [Oceanobacillus neutriphilus]GGP13434.1 spore germination protein GerM [Oceanobacillus neutriphilus]